MNIILWCVVLLVVAFMLSLAFAHVLERANERAYKRAYKRAWDKVMREKGFEVWDMEAKDEWVGGGNGPDS